MDISYDTAIRELEAEVEKLTAKTEGLKFAIETLKSIRGNGVAIMPEREVQAPPRTNLFNEVVTDVTPSERKELVYQAVVHLGRYSKLKAVVSNLDNRFTPAQVRLALINLFEERRIDKIKVSTSNEDTFYGLHEWKDGKDIKSDHLYDKKQVVGSTLLT